MNLRSNLKDLGYNQEEAYFHKKERELIDKLHEQIVQTPQKEEKVIPLPQGRTNNKPTFGPTKAAKKAA